MWASRFFAALHWAARLWSATGHPPAIWTPCSGATGTWASCPAATGTWVPCTVVTGTWYPDELEFLVLVQDAVTGIWMLAEDEPPDGVLVDDGTGTLVIDDDAAAAGAYTILRGPDGIARVYQL